MNIYLKKDSSSGGGGQGGEIGGGDVQNELTPVDTVDSTSLGFEMYMFKYPCNVAGNNYNNDESSRIYSDGSYGDGSTKLGLWSETVSENGFPKLVSDNTNVSNWFDPENTNVKNYYNPKQVNRLF